MAVNVSTASPAQDRVAELLTILSQTARIQILFIIRTQEACVCHLEAVLGIRQAGISQHLMALRQAGLVSARRAGRFIYYGVRVPDVIPMLEQAALVSGINPQTVADLSKRPISGCPCPQCSPPVKTGGGCIIS